MEKGIGNLIEICRQFGMEREEMEAVLAEKYGMSRTTAEEKVRLYWK
ncbi:MAG: hypothetical protein Q4C58_02545 [Eubacteriales bacterium]|nr:hypothetical protein [Eubacteriales bacterium]